MTTAPKLQALVIYALVVPAAVILGYNLASDNPLNYTTIGTVGLVVGLLVFPLLLKFHRAALFLVWNTTAVVFLLPGAPQLWIVLAFFSLGLAILQRMLSRDMRFIHAPSVVLPVICIVTVVAVTAKLTGGIGLRAFGGQSMGGKSYFYLFAGAAGLMAMLSARIPMEKSVLYTGLFFLGAISNAIGELVNFVPPSMYFLFMFFPVASLPGQQTITISRYVVASLSLLGIFWFLLARYGLKGLMGSRNVGKMFLALAVFVLALGGGFRSLFLMMAMTVFILFYLEGMFRTRYFIVAVGALLLAGALLIPFASRLPMSIQRSLSILPLDVKPQARLEAESSNEWRVEMWKTVLPEVPKYFWLGKGVGISPIDMDMTQQLVRRGLITSQEEAMLAGSYHNGALTVLIPFGIWGLLGWLWFLVASLRALYLNYRYGDERLKSINTFLYAYFLARTIEYFVVFGEFRNEFMVFAGIVGLGLALNGGICRPVSVTAPAKPAPFRFRIPIRPLAGFRPRPTFPRPASRRGAV